MTCSWTLPRDADAAGLGQRLQPGRDIDAVAEEIAALDDDVAEIDADAQADPPVRPAAPALAAAMPLLQRRPRTARR